MKKLIVISPENNIPHEIFILISLFENGLKYFHLRKPNATEKDISNFIKEIPSEFYNKIILHSQHHLAKKFQLKGNHLTEATRRAANKGQAENAYISSSFHNLQELTLNVAPFDYVFLSPIFNSISKTNYHSSFSLDDLKRNLASINQKVIALGGVDQANIKLIKDLNFAGAAVLGAVWQNKDPLESFLNIRKLLEDSE